MWKRFFCIFCTKKTTGNKLAMQSSITLNNAHLFAVAWLHLVLTKVPHKFFRFVYSNSIGVLENTALVDVAEFTRHEIWPFFNAIS